MKSENNKLKHKNTQDFTLIVENNKRELIIY